MNWKIKLAIGVSAAVLNYILDRFDEDEKRKRYGRAQEMNEYYENGGC